MKKIFILIIIGFFSFKLFAQTTLEEYNFVTKGYKIQIESGLDMKKGYRLTDLLESLVESGVVKRQLIFKGLFRVGETNPCAIMIVYRRLDTDYIDYTCIPHYKSSKEIWDLCFDKLKTYSGTSAEALLIGLSRATAYFDQNN